jgi:Holliday junction resolvase RusA-like endonuclease
VVSVESRPRIVFSFSVDGVPAPQGSKTIGKGKRGPFVREDNPATMPWRQAIAFAAREAMDDLGLPPLTDPVLLEISFRFPRPKSHYRTGKHAGELKPSAPAWCATQPDLDKLVRAVGDAITGIVVVSDAQIVEVEAVKVYGTPGMHLVVGEMP